LRVRGNNLDKDELVGLHKGGVFQIAAEDGVADIDDNGLGRLGVLRITIEYQKPDLQTKQGTRATYNDARHMNV
jgi:hypothetical protein